MKYSQHLVVFPNYSFMFWHYTNDPSPSISKFSQSPGNKVNTKSRARHARWDLPVFRRFRGESGCDKPA